MKLGFILSFYLWVSIVFGVYTSVNFLNGNICGVIIDAVGIFVYSALTIFTLKAYLRDEDE